MSKDTERKGARARYDWQAIRLEYTTSPAGEAEVTFEALARKWGCGKRQLFARSSAERWMERREEYRRKAAEIAQRKAAESEGDRLHRHAEALRLVQERGAEAIRAGKIVPTPGQLLDAIKAERVLYGEADGAHEEIPTGPTWTHEERVVVKAALAELPDDATEHEEAAAIWKAIAEYKRAAGHETADG